MKLDQCETTEVQFSVNYQLKPTFSSSHLAHVSEMSEIRLRGTGELVVTDIFCCSVLLLRLLLFFSGSVN